VPASAIGPDVFAVIAAALFAGGADMGDRGFIGEKFCQERAVNAMPPIDPRLEQTVFTASIEF
jgi:hypothetical protein